MKLITCLQALLFAAACCSAHATPLLSEGFEDVAALTGQGWQMLNASAPPGDTNWFQGDPGVFAAAGGPAASYIAANFTGAAYGGVLDNWLLTPLLPLVNGASLTFSLRLLGEGLTDRIDVFYAVDGVYTLLAAYVSELDTGWLQHTLLVQELAAPASGRFAFRYSAEDTSLAANYVGIDEVNVNLVPEPATSLLVMLGLVLLRRRKRRPPRGPRLAALGLSGLALTVQAAQAEPPQRADGVMQFPHVQVVTQPPTTGARAPGDGFMAYKDPLTGQLTQPDAELAALLTAQQRGIAGLARQAAPVATPVATSAPLGGLRLMLDQRHARYAIARKDAAGHITASCEPAPGERQ